jgi:hypothetical protein
VSQQLFGWRQDRSMADFETPPEQPARWRETAFAVRCAINASNVITGPKNAQGLYPVATPSVTWFNEIFDKNMTG